MGLRHALFVLLIATLSVSVGYGSDLGMGPEQTISAGSDNLYYPEAATRSGHPSQEQLVVWHSTPVSGNRTVMGSILGADGTTVVDDFMISHVTDPAKDHVQPAVSYDPINDRYLVVYSYDFFGNGSDWDVLGRFVTPDGSLLGAGPFSIAGITRDQWRPRIDFNPDLNEFMVTWFDSDAGLDNKIGAIRLTAATGLPVGNIIEVAYGPEPRHEPDVAYNHAEAEYLIVYTMMEAINGGSVLGRRVGADVIGDEIYIAAWPGAETVPRVASRTTHDDWLVVWQADSGGPDLNDIYGRRVWIDSSDDVELSPPVRIMGGGSDDLMPDVAGGVGPEYLVTYEVNSGGSGILARTFDSNDLLGPAVAVDVPALGSYGPRVSPQANGEWFVMWEEIYFLPPSSYRRAIKGRRVGDLSVIFADGFESGDTSLWSGTAH